MFVFLIAALFQSTTAGIIKIPPRPPTAVTNQTWNVLMNGVSGVMVLQQFGTIFTPDYEGTITWDAPYLFVQPGKVFTTSVGLSNIAWTRPFSQAWVCSFTFHLVLGNNVTYNCGANLILGQVPGLGYYTLNGNWNVGFGSPYPFSAVVASGSLSNYPSSSSNHWTTSTLANGYAGGLDLDFVDQTDNLYMDTVPLPNFSPQQSNENATHELLTSKHLTPGEYFTWDRSNGQHYTALTSQTGVSAYGQFTDNGWPDQNFPGAGFLAAWTYTLTLGTYSNDPSYADLKCALLGDYNLLYGSTTVKLTLTYAQFDINPYLNPPPFIPCDPSQPSRENPSGGYVKGVLTNTASATETVPVKISNRHWGWYIYFSSSTVSPGTYDGLFDNYYNPTGLHGRTVAGGVSYPLHGVGPL